MNVDERSNDWFPAKKYGWGWGLPSRWQGWLTLFLFVSLAIVDAVIFDPGTHPFAFFVGMGALSAAVVAVCYLKGAPPAWRWGKS